MEALEKTRDGTPPACRRKNKAAKHFENGYPTRKHQRRRGRAAAGTFARMPALFAASPLLLLFIGGLSRAGVSADVRGVVGGGEYGEWVASGAESQGAVYLKYDLLISNCCCTVSYVAYVCRLWFALPCDPSINRHLVQHVVIPSRGRQ